MNKKIQTYQDLLEEKEKLEILFRAQKELVQLDLKVVKAEMRPALKAVRVVGKMFTRDKSNGVFGSGAERVIDFVFQRFVLNKAGLVAKLVVPFLVKNVSSHVVAESRDGWVKKLRTWISKKKNGKVPPGPDPLVPPKETKLD